MLRFLVAIFISVVINHAGVSQTTAAANVSATIIHPVSTTKVEDLSFGEFTIGSGPGSIVLQAEGSVVPKGSIKYQQSQRQQSATLTLMGNSDYVFDVTVPVNVVVVRTNGTEIMMVEAFTTTKKRLPDNVVSVKVGGTLNVPPASKAGEYIDRSEFSIVINYN